MSLLVTALPPFALAAAQDESGALKEMAHRGFSDEGDVAAAIAAVDEVGGVALAADLAKEHITRARAAAAEVSVAFQKPSTTERKQKQRVHRESRSHRCR